MVAIRNPLVIETDLSLKDESFSCHKAEKGDSLLIGCGDDDCIVFFISGAMQIIDSKGTDVTLTANHMYSFSMKQGLYSGSVLSNTEFISLRITSLRPHVSAIRLQTLFNSKCPIKEEITNLEFGDILFLYLQSIKLLKANNICTMDIYDVKRVEFLFYLKELYTEEKLAYFFNETLSKYTNFKILVYSKYTNSITVKELAEECYMTTRTFMRRFKSEFGISPHKWLIEQKIKNLNDLIFNKGRSLEYVLEAFDFSSKNEFKQFCVRYKLFNILDALKQMKN